jgi:uncharacterized membrane protein YjdF
MMKAKVLQLIGAILLALTIIYVALFKGEINIEKSIWLSEVTYMYILGALLVFAPFIKSKLKWN